MTFKHEKRIPPVVWTVVADRTLARFLSASWPEVESWKEMSQIAHGEGGLTQSEVVTDRPGTFAERHGGHHAGQDETDFKHQSAERFVAEILDQLEAARTDNLFGKLIIVAPPLFLGVLRKKMSDPLRRMVIREIDHNYTHGSLDEISRKVGAALTEDTTQQNK